MATSYYFWGLQRMGLLRGREKMVYWCMPLFLLCFLSSFYHFLSFSPFFLFLVSYYSLAIGCSPFGLSFSWVPLWVPPLLSASLRCSPPPLGTSSVSSMATSSFYSELIQWDFSLLPLGFHQLFLACCEHSFKTTHQLIGCPTTTSAQNTFAAALLISWQNSLLIVLAVYLYL